MGGCCVVDSTKDFGPFHCFLVEILKYGEQARNEECGLVFRRAAFVLLEGPPEGVVGHESIVFCEDLGAFRRLGVEILKKRDNG